MSFSSLHQEVIACTRCPRLRSHCEEIARRKKREYREWDYWGRPVPGFGDPKAKIWIVGLAPGAHGSNRTGRMFTGDSSGVWLYRALHRSGFANQALSRDRNDGLKLTDVYISAAARCAPPDNKPHPDELSNCFPYLEEELRKLKQLKLFMALGSIAFKTILGILEKTGTAVPKPRPKFSHNELFQVGKYQILSSYHPSRQNTQTGLLTDRMWQAVFDRARSIV